MRKIKFGKKTYQIQFGYIATAKSGIIGKLIKTEKLLDAEEGEELNYEEYIGELLLLIPELTLIGLQKFHRDEFGYNYDTEAGKQEALEKVGDLIDSYFDNEDADINVLMGDLKDELFDNSFLSKLFQQEQEKQEKVQKKQEN